MQPVEDKSERVLLRWIGAEGGMIEGLVVSKGGDGSKSIGQRLRRRVSRTEEECPDCNSAKLRSRKDGRYRVPFGTTRLRKNSYRAREGESEW